MKSTLKNHFFVLLFLGLVSCTGAASGPAMTVSVSADGNYVISSHRDNSLILWDINNKKRIKITDDANIYSAYFAKGGDYYIWQGLNNVVHIESVAGVGNKTFLLDFPTYGHLISNDLTTYYAANDAWGIVKRTNDGEKTIVHKGDEGSFMGHGKLLNMQISDGSPGVLLSSGYVYDWEISDGLTEREKYHRERLSYEGVTLWDTHTLQPYAKLPGNAAKTYATFSPDGKYVVSGSENGNVLVWETGRKRLLFYLASLFHGKHISDGKDYSYLTGEAFAKKVWDKTGLIPPPSNYHGEAVLSLKFIDPDHFLRFTTYEPYAILYEINNPLPLKYLPLGTLPLPAVSDYSRNAAIDSAPEAGILVTGQRDGNGINVYKYDKDKQTLDRIWVIH